MGLMTFSFADSASLVAQLKSLTPNQMIVIVAHDDASTRWESLMLITRI